jgi:hypothetical protein
MLIETTMHVHIDIMKTLNNGADATGRGLTSIIKLLMQRVMEDNKKLLKSYSRVKYQERDEKENWNRIHIVLNEYEYEYYLDMRKFYKMSVSFILAFAVMRYLNEIVNELLDRNKNTDNYFYRNYIFIKETVDGIVCWQIYWGIPIKLLLS